MPAFNALARPQNSRTCGVNKSRPRPIHASSFGSKLPWNARLWIVSTVFTPPRIGSPWSATRMYTGASAACQSCAWTTDGRTPFRRVYSSAPRHSTAKRNALSPYSPRESPYSPPRSYSGGASTSTAVTPSATRCSMKCTGYACSPNGTSAAHPGAAPSVGAPRYFGTTTVTRWPRRASASGSALETSDRPPVRPYGRISDVTNRMSSTSEVRELRGVREVPREVLEVLLVRLVPLVLWVLLAESDFFAMQLKAPLSHETMGAHAEFAAAGARRARDPGADRGRRRGVVAAAGHGHARAAQPGHRHARYDARRSHGRVRVQGRRDAGVRPHRP